MSDTFYLNFPQGKVAARKDKLSYSLSPFQKAKWENTKVTMTTWIRFSSRKQTTICNNCQILDNYTPARSGISWIEKRDMRVDHFRKSLDFPKSFRVIAVTPPWKRLKKKKKKNHALSLTADVYMKQEQTTMHALLWSAVKVNQKRQAKLKRIGSSTKILNTISEMQVQSCLILPEKETRNCTWIYVGSKLEKLKTE